MKLNAIAVVPPVLLTCFELAYAVVFVMSTNAAATSRQADVVWTVTEAVMTFGFVLLHAGWAIGATQIAAGVQGSGELSLRPVRWSIAVFFVSGVIVACLVFPYRLGNYAEVSQNPFGAVVGALFAASYVVAAWQTAAVLSKVEALAGRRQSTFVTFLFVLYLIVGAWFLRPRLLSLQAGSRAATSPTASTPTISTIA